ncbi:MAG: 2-amino-4-hydroxy-6-hydroxymethyldihydropteridine diphosphokinase [Bacteroidales bacterium]|nr:2-amino-4-hydroxy-6-hydroxymethyldihydropteridine diphosphokinase [Candidatus Physcousia equi]
MNSKLTYLGLGSNLGDRYALIRQALCLLEERVGRIAACSSLIETEPWGFKSDHPFINAVVALRTELSARDLLLATQQIECELGRQQKSTRPAPVSDADSPALPQYADRPIDVDILLYGDEHIDTDITDNEGALRRLTVPHPLMQQRDFVMRPLREIR